MILLDIQVPAINKTYDFELEEELTAGELTGQIVGIIAEREELCCNDQKMYLYAMSREIILDENCSLKQQKIKSGETLYLI